MKKTLFKVSIAASVFKKICIKPIISFLLIFFNPLFLFQGENCLVIKGVHILKSDGVLADGYRVIIEKGKIKELGPEAEIPAGASIIEGQGKWLIPGLMDAYFFPTTLAKEKPEKSDYFTPQEKTTDSLNPGKYPIQSSRVWEVLKIRKEKFRDALKHGVTSLLVMPDQTRIISGLAGVIKLKPEDVFLESSILSSSFALKIGFERKRIEGLQSHMGIMWEIRRFFEEEKYAGTVLFETDTEEEMARALSLQAEFRFPVVFLGKMDGLSALKEILEKNIPIILSSPAPTETAGFSEKLAVVLQFRRPAALFSAGNATDPLGTLISIRPWLQEERIQDKDLYQLITSDFARILGLSHRIGSIERGRDADLVMLDGDPLQPLTKVEKVFIDGEVVYEAGKEK